MGDNKRIHHHIDRILGRYKSEEFINLVRRWIENLDGKKILKTDLYEEAFGEDEILFSLSEKNPIFFALDISEKTTRKAYINQKEWAFTHRYITADVRNLPFESNIFDVILSTSTLDHFNSQDDLIKSLIELKRVTKPGGNLIITLNNKYNINFFLFLKLEQFLGLVHYPIKFYSPRQLRTIFQKVGLYIQSEDITVHIISPVKSILLLMRKVLGDNFVDCVAEKFILFFQLIGKIKKTKLFTGWFIALNCVKKV